jgi:hypothetical protein
MLWRFRLPQRIQPYYRLIEAGAMDADAVADIRLAELRQIDS